MSDEFDLNITPLRKQRVHSANPNPTEPFEDNTPTEKNVTSRSNFPQITIEGAGSYDDDTRSADPVAIDDETPQPKPQRKARSVADDTPQQPRQPRRVAVKRTPKRKKTTIIDVLTDRRFHLFIATVLILTAGVFAIVLWSYLKNAAADQSHILNHAYWSTPGEFQNVGRGFGAWLSNLLFGQALGLGAWMMVVYLAGLGVSIIVPSHSVRFVSFTFKCLLVAIATSMIAGLISYHADTVVFWGGVQGHQVNKWLLENTGWPGDFFVNLVLLAAVIFVFFNAIKSFVEKAKEMMPTFRSVKSVDYEYDAHDEADSQPAEPQPVAVGIDDAPQPAYQPIHADEGFSIDDSDNSADDLTADSAATAADAGDVLVAEVEAPSLDSDSAPVDESDLTVVDGLYDHRAELSRYRMPETDILDEVPQHNSIDQEEQNANIERIVKTLNDYKVEIASIKATVGPTVTLYQVVPKEGTRIAQIKRLEDEIAMNLQARAIRIIAPLPGKGAVGIEVPNNSPETVSMRAMLESRKFRESKKALPIALGATIQNEVFVTDLASMPHVLVAGATGQGKSVGLNVIIASLLYKKHPSELKFVLIDPKKVEFSLYERLERHYLAKLPDDSDAIVTDTDRVLSVLNSLCVEMDHRYSLLKDAGVKVITEYNQKFTNRQLNPEKGHFYMPYIVVIIDEFADLIMMEGRDIELPVMRITQKARAVGIHMIIATQRPSTNVLTGLIKSNCPARIAFRVMQMVDSRTILDRPGANQLIGRGDMLYSAGGEIERMQCAFISTEEIESLVDWVDEQPGFQHAYMLPEPQMEGGGSGGASVSSGGGSMDRDPLFEEAARFIVRQTTASTSSLQRRFEIGYNRAGKIIDQMEALGIVGPASGSKPRSVLMDSNSLELLLERLGYNN